MYDRITRMLESPACRREMVHKLSRRHNIHDAEDIVQEAAIRLFQAEPRESIREPDRYLNRTLKRCEIDHHRREKCRVKLVSDRSEHKACGCVDWSKVPELVDTLPPVEQDTVRRMVDGMSDADIAAEDRVQQATVRKRLSRAHRRIAVFLGVTG